MTLLDLAPLAVAALLALWLCEREKPPVIRRHDRTLDLTGYHIKNFRRRG